MHFGSWCWGENPHGDEAVRNQKKYQRESDNLLMNVKSNENQDHVLGESWSHIP